MGKKTVEFDAHKVVKQEKEISFTKKDGTPVDFEARVPTKVPVHVKFKVDPNKKR
jgi:hypothetical protein